jgi:hypothetical protein
MGREPYELLLDELKMTESAGLRELCSVTFPWISYQADDVLLTSVGSTSLSKSTSRQPISVSLIKDRDLLRCSKIEKVASGVTLRMDSYDLHATRFFDKNKLNSLFYSLLLVVSFSSYGRFFPVSGGRGRQLHI